MCSKNVPFIVQTPICVDALQKSEFEMNFQNLLLVVLMILCIFHLNLMESRGLDFTNVKCTSLDKTFSDFAYCYLKAENRTYKYLSLRVILHKTPVTKVRVNIALYKRSNGLRPVSFNFTVDGCQLMSDHHSPWVNFIISLFAEYSNMNHSCPYDHDIIVDKLPANFILQKFKDFVPFPEGDYVFSSNWIAYGINRANVRVHVSYT